MAELLPSRKAITSVIGQLPQFGVGTILHTPSHSDLITPLCVQALSSSTTSISSSQLITSRRVRPVRDSAVKDSSGSNSPANARRYVSSKPPGQQHDPNHTLHKNINQSDTRNQSPTKGWPT